VSLSVARSSQQTLQHGAQRFCFDTPRHAKLSLRKFDFLISIVPAANGEDVPLVRPDLPHEMSDRVTGTRGQEPLNPGPAIDSIRDQKVLPIRILGWYFYDAETIGPFKSPEPPGRGRFAMLPFLLFSYALVSSISEVRHRRPKMEKYSAFASSKNNLLRKR
jgi:hypothetical protein